MRIEFEEYQIETVMDYFVKGFVFKKGEKLFKYETTYDPSNRRIIFKLYISKQGKK